MEIDPKSRRHKGMGIASFSIALFTFVGFFLTFAVAGVFGVSGSGTPTLEVIVGFIIILLVIIDLVGIGLGVAGVLDKTSKKVFPILGITLGTGLLVSVCALIAIGLSMKG